MGMPNWRTINKQNCLYFNTGSAYAVVTGEMSNLTITTNKGFHIWFTYDPDYKTTVDCFNDYKGVDIRNDAGIVFCSPTKYMMSNGSIVEYIDLGGTMEQPPTYLKSYIKTTPIREIQANTPVKQSVPKM